MCDYCDCRSHPEIAALSADHDVLLGLLRDLRVAADADARADAAPVVARLHDILHGHAHREERGVFTELRTEVGDDYIAAFEHDHDVVHALLDRADGAEWRDAAAELIAVLGDHIGREESDLFPAAHQLLLPAQWDAVDDAVAAEVAVP